MSHRLPRRIRKQSWRLLYSSPRAARLDRENWQRCSAQVSNAFKCLFDACERIVVAINKMFNDVAASFMGVRLPSFV